MKLQFLTYIQLRTVQICYFVNERFFFLIEKLYSLKCKVYVSTMF